MVGTECISTVVYGGGGGRGGGVSGDGGVGVVAFEGWSSASHRTGVTWAVDAPLRDAIAAGSIVETHEGELIGEGRQRDSPRELNLMVEIGLNELSGKR